MKRLLLLICTLLCANVLLAQDFWKGTLHYYISNGTATVYGYDWSAHPTNIVIPSTVTYEGISYSVTSIGDSAFYECSSLTTVTIPNSVTYIGDRAFRSCSSLTSVTIGNSVTSIGDYAFAFCWNLTSVTIGNSVTSIGDYAFKGCSLTSVTIPNSVTSIGKGAFKDCSSLTTLNFNAINCEDFNSYMDIDDSPFYNCPITTINIGDSVQRIPASFASNLGSLTSVTIGNSVTSIGNEAFEYCSSLTSVTIPNRVTSIGGGAFIGCSSLQNITCLATTPPTLSDNPVFPNPNTATLTVPCGTFEVYNSSDWNIFFADRIEEDCEDNTGLEDAEETLLSFFPNPTKDKITFSQAIEKVEVIDLTGKTILTFSNVRTINIESLPAGAYYLRLTNEEKTSLQKVIKQ